MKQIKKHLFIPIGLPGIGKTTVRNQLLMFHPDIVVISPDEIRGVLTGDVNNQSRNKDVFVLANQLLEVYTDHGVSVFWDATNIKKQHREGFREIARQKGYTLIWIEFEHDIDLALQRNNTRAKRVPVDVIFRMANSYEKLTQEEEKDGKKYTTEEFRREFCFDEYVLGGRGTPRPIYEEGVE
jgi:predicted kinase